MDKAFLILDNSMDIASYFLFSLVSGVCGVVLWHFPFILPLSFCMYAWYSLIFCIVNYKKKEALSGKYVSEI